MSESDGIFPCHCRTYSGGPFIDGAILKVDLRGKPEGDPHGGLRKGARE